MAGEAAGQTWKTQISSTGELGMSWWSDLSNRSLTINLQKNFFMHPGGCWGAGMDPVKGILEAVVKSCVRRSQVPVRAI